MPFNGAGSYSPPGADFPAVPNTLIESAKFNSIINDIATALSTCITKDGQTTVTANIPMGGFRFTGLGAGASNGQSLRYEQLFTTGAVTLLGAMNWVKGADIASAATVDLSAATGNGVHITGTTAITAVTLGSGMWRQVIFDGILTLTHHATNNNLPGGANITTAAGDRALYWSDGTTVYCVQYQKATTPPLSLGTGVATALAVNVGTAGSVVLNGGALGTPASGDITNLAASAAQQEAASANNVAVTPLIQNRHPSALKGAGRANETGATSYAYNCTVTDTGTGVITWNWTVPFSAATYAPVPAIHATAFNGSARVSSISAGATEVTVTSYAGVATDPISHFIQSSGDQ